MEPEDREFMRPLLDQLGKAIDAMINRLDEGTERIRAETQQIRMRTEQITRSGDTHIDALSARTGKTRAGGYSPEEIRAHTREFVAQMRKERQAFLRRLERFDGQGA
jgi:hypothetical protein